MFSLFRKKQEEPDLSAAPRDFSFLGTDIHSHLVPAVDDGAPDMESSLELIRGLLELGYSKLITTPHVYLEFYNNNSPGLRSRFQQLQHYVQTQGVKVDLGLGAEYFLDNYFLNDVLSDDMLYFGKEKYLLVEVSMAGWPRQFADIIFSIQSRGYTPILAHPERYLFEGDFRVYEEWKRKGLLFQMNLLSLAGYYGKSVKLAATYFLDHGLYDFCGSDAHHPRHLEQLKMMASQRPELMLKLLRYEKWRNSYL